MDESDACPYPRPFPDDFTDCPAFQKTQFVPLDTYTHRLPSVWSCTHLRPASTGRSGRFYPQCRVGSAEDRVDWARRVHADRLAELRMLQDEMSTRFLADVERMWTEKARQEETAPGGAVHHELQEAAERYLAEVERFLIERGPTLERLGIPTEATIALIRLIVDMWINQPGYGTPEIPDEVLDRFPEVVRLLVAPDRAA